jgi:Pyruvate/2-oxoacid:ferredoxin oxidoreductase gamma subunit
MAINEGFDSTYIPSYGPESRGGTSYADIHLATEEVLSPACPNPHVLVAFNAMSLEKFAPSVRPGGLVIYDSAMAPGGPPEGLAEGVRTLAIPFVEIARDLGSARAKNMVAWGALQAATRLLPAASFRAVLEQAMKGGEDGLLALNHQAFSAGAAAVAERAAAVPA